jgi:hypothetical protein
VKPSFTHMNDFGVSPGGIEEACAGREIFLRKSGSVERVAESAS